MSRMREELGGKAVSVATGDSPVWCSSIRARLDFLDNMLTLKGLEIIHRRTQEAR